MLIPFGVFSAAGAGGGAAAGAYELISSTVLSGTQTTISFSSIAQTYKHLQLRWTAKSASSSGTIFLTMNGASSGYAWHYLDGNGSAVSSNNGTSAAYVQLTSAINPSTTANCFSGAIVDILDYASTTKNKTVKSLHGYLDAGLTPKINMGSGFLASTSAITDISLAIGGAQSFAIGSRVSLYGIKG